MSDVVNIKEAKGEVTPRNLLQKLLDNIEDIEQVVVITVDNKAQIRTGWSIGNILEILGMLEVAKDDILEETVIEE